MPPARGLAKRRRIAYPLRHTVLEPAPMRAEIAAVAAEIKQSLDLLRRFL
jgi:hypothetical protein